MHKFPPCRRYDRRADLRSVPPAHPINPHQQNRRQRNQRHRTTQRNARHIIGIATPSSHQVSHLIQNHSAANPECNSRQHPNDASARAKRQNERRRNYDQHSNKQMMNQVSARINMLHPHQVKIKPQTQNRPHHRQQDQPQRPPRTRLECRLLHRSKLRTQSSCQVIAPTIPQDSGVSECNGDVSPTTASLGRQYGHENRGRARTGAAVPFLGWTVTFRPASTASGVVAPESGSRDTRCSGQHSIPQSPPSR